MVSLLGAVVVLGAPAVLATSRAGADQVASTQSQITAVESQITAGAARVHQLTDAFDQANLTAATGAAQLAADRAGLAADRATLAGTEQALRQDVLQAYTGGAAGEAGVAPPAGTSDPGVSSAYINVAVGDTTDSLDQFRLQEQRLETDVATVAAQQRVNRAALAAAGAARASALAVAGAAQVRLAGLQAKLAALEAAQAAAAAAAHAPAPAVAQGGPVGNGLVAVVDTIVAAPTPPPAAKPPPAGATSPTPAATGPAPPAAAPPSSGGVWLQLRECESGDNYQADTGNGFYGAYQFSPSTWAGLGFPGRPDEEPPSMQDQAAVELQARSGWGAWPACSAALGLH